MSKIKKKNLEKLYEAIMQLAQGNFAYRINELDLQEDGTDLAMMLNMLGEELSNFFIGSNSFGEKNMTDPYTFVLDDHLNIKAINCRFSHLFNIHNEILNKEILQFLTKSSALELQHLVNSNFHTGQTFTPVKIILTFMTKHNEELKVWGYCHLIVNQYERFYFFRLLPLKFIKASQSEPDNSQAVDKKMKKTQVQNDILKIREVHQYILDNLHQSLPPLPIIARSANLNEYKLKKGFKTIYGITVFKFHLKKRLEMSKTLIESTQLPLKSISFQFGFKDYSHFLKAFKKKYGKSPKKFRNGNN